MSILFRATAAALCLTLAGCGQDRDDGPAAGPATSAVALTPAERGARLAALPTPYNVADLDNGQKQFGKCRSCHTLTPGGPNMTGPNLHGVFGRKAGAHPDYAYSDAIVQTGWVWDQQKLDGWLADPREFLPGTKMSFAGLDDAEDRRDLIAYLSVETAAQ